MDTNEIEACIKNIWSHVLVNFNIGPNDNFFELGGDSMQMMDMLFDVSKALKLEVEPFLLYQDASLRGFALLISAKLEKEQSSKG